MNYQNSRIAEVAATLEKRFAELSNKADILRAVELKALYDELKTLPADQRASFGQEVNALRQELQAKVDAAQDAEQALSPIDITAPFDVNAPVPELLPGEHGSAHPLMTELDTHIEIFARMGFVHMESRELDDEYHMFTSLNFPEDHPARDDYDTFMTEQTDKSGHPFLAPAHVSIMQNRLQKLYKDNLEKDQPVAVVYTGRTFRNEDVDARHEHTFYQVEISYIDKNINVGNLVATVRAWLSSYFQKDVELKIQPFYFPFTEPSFEFAASCPFCDKKGCNVCSQTGWIELGGCGMIHPNVLHHGGIDANVYTGFAGGFGLERMVMIKYGIEDVRHFESGKLDFLRQFS